MFTVCDGICADIKTPMSPCLLFVMESVLDIRNTDEPVFTICDGICAGYKDTNEPIFTVCDGICADIKTPMS